MGIELDVLVGNPEHELLFVATQVARAAGLKDPAGAANAHRAKGLRGVSLDSLMAPQAMSLPKDSRGYTLRTTTTLFSEPEVYSML
jgi:prophage antirepressor-like protein